MNAAVALGFWSWKRAVVVIALTECGPMMSYELITVWMPGLASSRAWNGGEEKWLAMSPPPDSTAASASGCAIDTVSGSSLAHSSGPNRSRAAICSRIACMEILTDGIAMRSVSRRSPSVLMRASRVTSSSGWAFMPEIARTSIVPRVFDHSVIMFGRPIAARSIELDSSASVSGAGPASTVHSTLTSPRPACLACCSISF